MVEFSADFETTTDENDCRVWCWGVCEISNIEKFEWGTDISSFIEWCKNQKDSTIYFHNLKFDGNFIISYLLRNGYTYSKEKEDNTFNTLISQTNQFYSIEIIFKKYSKKFKRVVFKDSLKKLPFKVSQIAKDFNYDILKLDIDYHKFRPVGYIPTLEELEYLKHDVQIVALALLSQFEDGLCKMTTGSDALNNFKKKIGSKEFKYTFPVLNLNVDKIMRKAYRGGWTYVIKKHKNVEIKEGIVFDVNSLYPYVMYEKLLPYGYPIHYLHYYKEDKEYPLYIQRIICEFKIKENHLPMIQCKNNFCYNDTEYLEESIEPTELWLSSVDLKLFLEHYEIKYIQYIEGYKFKGKTGMFKEYIDYWIEMKNSNKGAKKAWAKLMLNSLYGKFATNPNVTQKIPYLDDEGIVKYKLGDLEQRDSVYTPMGVFITSYAREKTIRTAQKEYDRFVYADTDSIHLIGLEEPNIDIDDYKLGYWKKESVFKRAKFIRAKTYIEDVIEPKQFLNVKCAGMTENIKELVTWENFNIGFRCDKKLKPKNVLGGVVLVESKFQIK